MIYREALETMQRGFNCAESVMQMAGKYYLPDISFDYANLVTGFGGGVGRSRAETCGALTGSVVAMSMIFGRNNPETSVDPIHDKISAFRDIFISHFNETICGNLRGELEGDALKKFCQEMTAETVVLLFDYLDSLGVKRKSFQMADD